MWDVEECIRLCFCMSDKYFKDTKAMQINRIFLHKVKFDLSSPINLQNNRDLNQGILHLWPKFDDSRLNRWWVSARTSSKWGKFWLWSLIWPWRSGSITPKTIGILTKVFYIYGTNLVILAWTGDELSRGQASDWCTHRRKHRQTDAGNDNTRRPKLASGKNGLMNTCCNSFCNFLKI